MRSTILWRITSTRFAATAHRIRIAATIEAVEDEAVEHLEEVNQAAEDTITEDKPNLQAQETIKPKIRTNQLAGTVLFRDIVKRTAGNASGKENLAMDPMAQHTGQSQNNLQSTRDKKDREEKMSREQLERCIQVNWLVFFRVFSKGRS
jgi:hypothetical protein